MSLAAIETLTISLKDGTRAKAGSCLRARHARPRGRQGMRSTPGATSNYPFALPVDYEAGDEVLAIGRSPRPDLFRNQGNHQQPEPPDHGRWGFRPTRDRRDQSRKQRRPATSMHAGIPRRHQRRKPWQSPQGLGFASSSESDSLRLLDRLPSTTNIAEAKWPSLRTKRYRAGIVHSRQARSSCGGPLWRSWNSRRTGATGGHSATTESWTRTTAC